MLRHMTLTEIDLPGTSRSCRVLHAVVTVTGAAAAAAATAAATTAVTPASARDRQRGRGFHWRGFDTGWKMTSRGSGNSGFWRIQSIRV